MTGTTHFIYRAIAIVMAMTVHELAHGLVSYGMGDPTPKLEDRLTLNPIKHIDPMGAFMLFVVGFGWAKPVMVDPRHYEDKKFGMVMTAFAGPFSNFLMAFLASLLISIGIYHMFLEYLITINLILGVFNMFPIPPLDGSKVFGALLPERLYFDFINFRGGFLFLLVLLMTGSISGTIMAFVTNIQESMYSVLGIM